MSSFVYYDNHKLYHITIMDLCDTIITISILLHITKHQFVHHSYHIIMIFVSIK